MPIIGPKREKAELDRFGCSHTLPDISQGCCRFFEPMLILCAAGPAIH
jgi:hypothetical protein